MLKLHRSLSDSCYKQDYSGSTSANHAWIERQAAELANAGAGERLFRLSKPIVAYKTSDADTGMPQRDSQDAELTYSKISTASSLLSVVIIKRDLECRRTFKFV